MQRVILQFPGSFLTNTFKSWWHWSSSCSLLRVELCWQPLRLFQMVRIGLVPTLVCNTLCDIVFNTDVCSLNQEVPNNLFDATLVISCVGIGILLLYWVFIRYKIYKQPTKGNLERVITIVYIFSCILFCV